MLHRSYKPLPPLGDFVDDLWLYDDYAQPHLKEWILPSGTIELVINLREDEFRIYDPATPERIRRFPGAMVSGAYSSIFVIDTLEHASVIGAHFKPGGAFPFLGLPAGELADLHVDLETLWGRSAAIALRERLCAAPTPDKLGILEGALLSHLFRPLTHHYAIGTALRAFTSPNGIWTVAALARRIGISQRRFIDVFRDEVGITPKLFWRIQRFHLALSAVQEESGSVNWAELAADCGYFDQSHLIRDFLEFSGLTPTDYLNLKNCFRRREPYIKHNHIPFDA